LKCSSVGGRVVVTNSGGDDGGGDTTLHFYVQMTLGNLFLLAHSSQTLAAAEQCARVFICPPPEPKTKLLVCELAP